MKYYLALVLFFTAQMTWGQSSKINNVYLWQDVLALEDSLNKSSSTAKDEIIRILKYYLTPQDTSMSNDTLKEKVKNNPFLHVVFPDEFFAQSLTNSSPVTPDKITGQAGDIGGFIEPTIVLDALARLIQTRIVDELNLAYLNRLREELNNDPIIKILLPRTVNALTALGTTYSFQYRSFLSTLRKSCIEDIEYFPQSMEDFIKNNRSTLIGSKISKDQYVILLATLRLMANVRNHPEDILADFETYDFQLPQNTFSDLEAIIKTTALLSNHLRSNDPEGTWVKKATRDKLLANPRAAYLFLGLIYAVDGSKLKEFKNASGVSVYALMQSETVVKWIKEFHQVLILVGELQQLIEDRGKLKLSNKPDLPHFSLQLIERILHYQFSRLDSAIGKQKGERLFKEILEIKYRVEQKRYASALTKAYGILKCPGTLDCADASKIQLYAEFFDAIVRETNADSLVHILSAFAAPVGSYSIKRRSPFSVSLSSFAGALGGNETLLGDNVAQRNKQAINSFAFTAPFGLALSKAIAVRETRGGHSLTAFFPIVDVGAITAFRFANSTATLPQVTWKNFLSPGAYLIFGFRQSPISLNAGFQYGPELRKIVLNAMPELIPSRRFSLGLTLDLHLFNLSQRLPPPAKPTTTVN